MLEALIFIRNKAVKPGKLITQCGVLPFVIFAVISV